MTPDRRNALRAGRSACWPAVLAAFLLAACSTSVTTTSGPVTEARSGPPQPGDADAGRRARVRLELAGAYFTRGQMDFALSEVKLAIAADPTLGSAYNLRALIHQNLGEQREAEENFHRALALNPRDIDALQNFGWYLCQQKRFGEANTQFEQILAIPQNRDSARTYLAQGVCQSRAGQLDDAERSLMRAYELDQGNVTVSFNLAELLLRRGEPERARFYVRRINSTPALVSAQTLWLAARIENKLGNRTGVQELGAQLRTRFRESREAVAFEKGQFDE
jgi:type IV pilus assembly protein PilF